MALRRSKRHRFVRLDSPDAKRLMEFEKDLRFAALREKRNKAAEAYYNPTLSLEEAAARAGVSNAVLSGRIRRFGLPTRDEVNRSAGEQIFRHKPKRVQRKPF